jgi:ADP-ribose pyrophosphatase YjhB (NUDIX family)
MADRSDREYPPRPIVGVGAVVLVEPDDEGRTGSPGLVPAPYGVLLVKRRFEPLAGRWSLPGGAVETGERLVEALRREVEEETGLVVDVGPVVEVFDRILRDDEGRVRYHYVLVDYLCRPREGHLRAGSDVSEAAVVDPTALDPYGLTPKARAVIAAALALVGTGNDDRLQYDGAPQQKVDAGS